MGLVRKNFEKNANNYIFGYGASPKNGPKKGVRPNFWKIFFARYMHGKYVGKVKKFQVGFVWSFFEKNDKK